MAYAMTKQGSLDNCITYEFICDTIADMNAIENRYKTIGTVAIVLAGESEGMEVYIAGSDKSWNNIGTLGTSGDSSAGAGAGLSIHICAQNEVSNGVPSISSPDENTIYLVSSGNTSGNLYEEYIYVNSAWEKFGAASIDLSGKADKTDTVLNTTLSRGRTANSSIGTGSLAFGNNVVASGTYSTALGYSATASGSYSHAEGSGTTASGTQSHAEGSSTTASGIAAHAEGIYTIALGAASHAEGSYNISDSYNNWAEWVANTEYQVGDKVKVTTTVDNTTTVRGYICKTANTDSSWTSSHWNQDSKMNYAHIVGNGTAPNARSNAYALDWSGNGYFAGNVYVGCNADSTGGTKLACIPDPPTSDGTYTLQATVSSGVVTYTWIAGV